MATGLACESMVLTRSALVQRTWADWTAMAPLKAQDYAGQVDRPKLKKF